MPAVDTGQGIFFTDHWIRIRKDGPASPGAGPAVGDARPSRTPDR
jgi:hypothetical protein